MRELFVRWTSCKDGLSECFQLLPAPCNWQFTGLTVGRCTRLRLHCKQPGCCCCVAPARFRDYVSHTTSGGSLFHRLCPRSSGARRPWCRSTVLVKLLQWHPSISAAASRCLNFCSTCTNDVHSITFRQWNSAVRMAGSPSNWRLWIPQILGRLQRQTTLETGGSDTPAAALASVSLSYVKMKVTEPTGRPISGLSNSIQSDISTRTNVRCCNTDELAIWSRCKSDGSRSTMQQASWNEMHFNEKKLAHVTFFLHYFLYLTFRFNFSVCQTHLNNGRVETYHECNYFQSASEDEVPLCNLQVGKLASQSFN